MTESRILTPQEAASLLDDAGEPEGFSPFTRLMLRTIATAPERQEAQIRAAVVKKLRKAELYFDLKDAQTQGATMADAMLWCSMQANAIENGADW